MSTKDWKNKELTSLLSEAWGFKFNTLQEFDEFNGTGEVQEESVEEEEVVEKEAPQSPYNAIEDATMDELNDMMRKAVQNENYELAARVRDEIEKRAR